MTSEWFAWEEKEYIIAILSAGHENIRMEKKAKSENFLRETVRVWEVRASDATRW